MIDLLAVEEPKPKPAKIRGVVRGSDRPVVQTHAVVSFGSTPSLTTSTSMSPTFSA